MSTIEEQVAADILDNLREYNYEFDSLNGDYYYNENGEEVGDFYLSIQGETLDFLYTDGPLDGEVWKKFKITVEEITE